MGPPPRQSSPVSHIQSEKHATEVDADGLIPLSTDTSTSLCVPPSTPALFTASGDSVGPHRSLHSLFNVTRIRHVTRYHKSISPCLGDSGCGRLEAGLRRPKSCDSLRGRSAIDVAAPMPVPAAVTKAYGLQTQCWKSFAVPQ